MNESLLFLVAYSSIIKRLVHPKITIMSSFTHPHAVPNLCDFCVSSGRVNEMLGRMTVSVTIDFHCKRKEKDSSPKNESLSLFTQPKVVPNLYNFFCGIQKKIFWVTRQFDGSL